MGLCGVLSGLCLAVLIGLWSLFCLVFWIWSIASDCCALRISGGFIVWLGFTWLVNFDLLLFDY